MSNMIVIKTQKELDKLPTEFKDFTYIEIRSDKDIWINVTKEYKNAHVTAYDTSQVTAYDTSQVTACDTSQVTACDTSQVRAYGTSQVTAYDTSQVTAYGTSQVTACGTSQVTAYDTSQVTACDTSQVTAYDTSQVRTYGTGQVTAYGTSQVTAYDTSQVRAYGTSQVRAYGTSQVTACDTSQVRAYGNSMISVQSVNVIIKEIKQNAIVSLDGVNVKLPKKAKTATVIKRKLVEHDIQSFIDVFNLTVENNSVILYKTVHKETGCDFRTGKIKYEGIVICPDFDKSKDRECGGGLHLCATPFGAICFADGSYKVLKCRVKLKDIVVYGKSIEKVRCRQVEVLEVVG
jgi:hypothetical protein